MTSGILNIDKPVGPTSHDVVSRVRWAAQTRRVGHAGTLDPLATGVLLVAVGRATRLLEYVTGRPKEYRATVRLGVTTTTYDAEGEVVAERPVAVSEEDVAAALDPFRGEIEQLPPMYSAVKQGGRKLYELARQGIEVAREPRPVTIYELELLDWQPPDVQLRVLCSAGTYIRSLAHDLGEALGSGAHLAELRRTAIGSFTVAEAVRLQELNPDTWREHCLSPDRAVAHMPRLDLAAGAVQELIYGRRILREENHPQAELVRAYDPAGQFVGVLVAQGENWQPKKIFVQ